MQKIKTDTCRSQVSDNLQHYIKLKGIKKLCFDRFFKYDEQIKFFYQKLYFDI